ncbi:MAG: hypothetical protein D3904_08600 [Candidatus Electrothrix sp. EH2]|nr:hypothetical protein [Candidatus Electrothrix sp. EH2]
MLFDKWRRKSNKKYTVTYGVKIIFVNNSSLFLISKTDGFVKDAVDYLYSFIAKSEHTSKKELIINFSDSSINIKEAVGSNIIGGNVEGNVTNG